MSTPGGAGLRRQRDMAVRLRLAAMACMGLTVRRRGERGCTLFTSAANREAGSPARAAHVSPEPRSRLDNHDSEHVQRRAGAGRAALVEGL
jgi:hypothetical protein